jgi:hypothetical protein
LSTRDYRNVFSERAVEVLGDLPEGRGVLLLLSSEEGKFFLFTSPVSPMPSTRS